ncbi:MAG: SLBB domain-containing protein [Melioribacteraceae bacterium]|nr:SLBB domain-containing protein [Melioribacteraceae bacterium]
MKKILLILLLLAITISKAQTISEEATGLNLSSMQVISVTIGGDFLVNGSFQSSPMERLDQFITRQYNLGKVAILNTIKQQEMVANTYKKIDSFSKRDILIKRYDGSELKIDLEKFRLTGDFSHNPYLKNGDVIIFPVYDIERNFIEITGAINKPGKYHYVKGDKLSDIIFYAKGISIAFDDVEVAEISRLSADGESEEVTKVKILNDFSLQSGDRIRILTNELEEKNFKIKILGEVNNPGEIYITKNSTTLSEIIRKAGGLKPNASLADAELIRENSSVESLKLQAQLDGLDSELDEIKLKSFEYLSDKIEVLKMYRLISLVREDTSTFNIDNQLRIINTSIELDFTKILDNDSDEANYIMKDKDVVVIPEKNTKIYVWGQVRKPGYYNYKEGHDYNYYIGQAGGITEFAKDFEEIIIIKKRSREWIKIDDEVVPIEPGDYVYVPKDFPISIWYSISRIGTIAGIIGSIATLIILMTQLGK